jgi:transcriptional regulator with XRE-family HTH domain
LDDTDIGQRLHAIRLQNGLSQRELARRAGLTHGTVSFIERNKISPSIGTMRQILDCLGLTLSDFFARETEPARYFFTRADLIDVGSGGVSLLQVGQSLVGRPLQVLLEIYPPGAESARAPYRAVRRAVSSSRARSRRPSATRCVCCNSTTPICSRPRCRTRCATSATSNASSSARRRRRSDAACRAATGLACLKSYPARLVRLAK